MLLAEIFCNLQGVLGVKAVKHKNASVAHVKVEGYQLTFFIDFLHPLDAVSSVRFLCWFRLKGKSCVKHYRLCLFRRRVTWFFKEIKCHFFSQFGSEITILIFDLLIVSVYFSWLSSSIPLAHLAKSCSVWPADWAPIFVNMFRLPVVFRGRWAHHIWQVSEHNLLLELEQRFVFVGTLWLALFRFMLVTVGKLLFQLARAFHFLIRRFIILG